MELSTSPEPPIPLPLSSRFGGHGHEHDHDHDQQPRTHIIANASPLTSNGNPFPAATSQSHQIEDHHHHHHHHLNNLNHHHQAVAVVTPTSVKKPVVKYRECLKNHAASMGGNATDGCGEFMPTGEEGTLEALTCSACNCHRNFHRKEIEGDPSSCDWFGRVGRKFIVGAGAGHHKNIIPTQEPTPLGYPTPTGTFISSRTPHAQPHHMIMSYNMGMGMGMGSLHSESDEQDGGGVMVARPSQMVKKRFRTKFTAEQKEKMLEFAEKVGWKIQKQEESVVQQLCQEIGVKRRVLKVWMHNNKHNLAKKDDITSPTSLN